MSEQDMASFNQLDIEYYGLLASCDLDRIRFNLGDYRQSAGRHCDALNIFESIESKQSIPNLRQIIADAALQCARDSASDQAIELAHKCLQAIVDKTPHETLSQRRLKGRLLGAWRDLFAIPASGSAASEIAQSIHARQNDFLSWKKFLLELRSQLRTWQSALYPQTEPEKTAEQYMIAVKYIK